MSTTLATMVDRGLFLSVEHQRAFEDRLVPDAARVDFSVPRILLPGIGDVASGSDTDDGDHGAVPAEPYLLGSSSPGRGTWIWSWQEPEHFLPSVLAAAESARRFGVQHDVEELRTDEVPLGPELPERLVIASKVATGLFAHYSAGAGGGARVWMLVQGDALTLDGPSVRSVGRTIAEGLHTGLATDHRAAVESYARLRGVHLSDGQEGRVVLSTEDGGVELAFDGSRISGIDIVDSHLPAGWAPTPIAVTLVEPDVRERPAPTRQHPTPAPAPQRIDESVPVPHAADEPVPVPDAVLEPEHAADEPVSVPDAAESSAEHAGGPVGTSGASPAPSTEAEPADRQPTEPEEIDQHTDEAEESDEQQVEPKRRGIFGRLFGR